MRARRSAALALICWAAGAAAQVADKSGASTQRLQQLMQAKPSQVTPERLAERERLLKLGEAALARSQVLVSQDAFDRAALILHAADTEMALVRSYMQGGEYRRALAFGAHTAGAHLDVASGSALYAWLLHAGGQAVIAQRLLTEAQARMPTNQVIAQAQQQLKSPAPIAEGELLKVPLRLAPYGGALRLPPNAMLAGSGMLLPGGKHALVPLAALPRSGKLWLRNGLGQASAALREQTVPTLGIALLRLSRPLAVSDDLVAARREPFAGSVGYVVEYAVRPAKQGAQQGAAPAWPLLHSGFLGAGATSPNENTHRLLGIDMPAGPRGGAVFDAFGQLAGVALSAGEGQPDRWVALAQVQAALPQLADKRSNRAAVPAANTALPKAAADRVYEIGLKTSLQLIVAP